MDAHFLAAFTPPGSIARDGQQHSIVWGVRYFNTAGPCVPGWHYMLAPEPRLPEARSLIEQGRYFALHAPRQTGKTTTLGALARDLTAEGQHVALLFSCEQAKVASDIEAAGREILGAIRVAAEGQRLAPELMPPSPWPEATAGGVLREGLTEWARQCPLPIVLFFDEIDALRNESLLSVLAQLRAGYNARPEPPFPWSVVLCGLRDVRDYRAASGADPDRMGTSSPFNVKVASLRIGDFTRQQVAELYRQHTADTGQEFTPEAVDLAFEYSQGQPWLVNAIAYEITYRMGISPSDPVTAAHVDMAKERLILARETHLDSLVARLNEPRVRRVIEPVLAGTTPVINDVYQDDIAYVRDLGLIAQGNPVRVANPIYREVIARVLGDGIESIITSDPHSLLLSDGRLDFRQMIEDFTEFWIENGEILTSTAGYTEAAAQLVFMAYLHRMVNGDGYIDREYAVGSGRIDLLVRRDYGDRQRQREAFELKVWRKGRSDPLNAGLKQLDGYLDRFQLDTGTLVIFDRRPEAAPIYERTLITHAQSPAGRTITVIRA